MSHVFGKCGNCGAPLQTSADGRELSCAYCGVSERRAVDPARLFSALRAEAGSAEELLQGLARRLAEAFPDLSRLEWSGGFLSAKRVVAFELTTAEARFRLCKAPHGVQAERAEVVRGIAVKTATLPVDEWLGALSASLSSHAAENSRALEALQRLTRS